MLPEDSFWRVWAEVTLLSCPKRTGQGRIEHPLQCAERRGCVQNGMEPRTLLTRYVHPPRTVASLGKAVVFCNVTDTELVTRSHRDRGKGKVGFPSAS